MVSGRVGFGIQAFAYVATYISAVALVGFGGLAYAYGMQMLLVAAGNVWLGTWIVYRYLAWPTRLCQRNLQARTPVQLLANGHRSPLLGRCLALIFAVFLGVYASAVIKGAALLLAQIMPVPVWLLVWIVALLVAAAIYMGGLRGVLFWEWQAWRSSMMEVGEFSLRRAQDGAPTERSEAAKRFAIDLEHHREVLADVERPAAEVAIFASMTARNFKYQQFRNKQHIPGTCDEHNDAVYFFTQIM